jgi:hypothetical protein
MSTNMIGSIVANIYFVTCILVFLSRLLGKPVYGTWIGYLQVLMVFPLAYLLLKAPAAGRPWLYYLQLSLMFLFVIVEAVLDIILKVDFRSIRWSVISYVIFFFAATGGMVGVAANSGTGWTVSAAILFLIMAGLAFAQRAVTGL